MEGKLMILLVVLAIHSAASQRCPPGWEQFGESCYSFGMEMVTWIDAMNFCELNGAHLVHVNDFKEDEYIVKSMKGRHINIAWTGGSERLHRGMWEWVPSGGLFGRHETWFGGEPAGAEEDCLVIDGGHSYKWMDTSCTLANRFICEMKVPSSEGNTKN